ncbi:MAG: hypothetical protein U1E15_13850 [Hyphomicrobiales bacterium]
MLIAHWPSGYLLTQLAAGPRVSVWPAFAGAMLLLWLKPREAVPHG